jgi:hypothetical protein
VRAVEDPRGQRIFVLAAWDRQHATLRLKAARNFSGREFCLTPLPWAQVRLHSRARAARSTPEDVRVMEQTGGLY